MLQLEDNFVSASFVIPAYIGKEASKMTTRSEIDCAQVNSDVADDTPKTKGSAEPQMRMSHMLLLEL